MEVKIEEDGVVVAAGLVSVWFAPHTASNLLFVDPPPRPKGQNDNHQDKKQGGIAYCFVVINSFRADPPFASARFFTLATSPWKKNEMKNEHYNQQQFSEYTCQMHHH